MNRYGNEYNPHGLDRNRFESPGAFDVRVDQDARHQARRAEQIDRCSCSDALASDKRDDERRHPAEYDRDYAS